MITLNLITIQDRKRLTQHRLTILVRDITVSLLSLSILLSILLLACYFILTKNFIEISQNSMSTLKSSDIVGQEVMQINENLKKIEEIQAEHVDWLKVLLTLNDLIPEEDIQVTNLEINPLNKTISLHGKSASRDQFLVLKQNLEDSKLFDKIDSPLSNLLSAKNLNFKLEIKFTPETLLAGIKQINPVPSSQVPAP